MGHPKKLRKKYDTPKKPYDKERLQEERKLVKTFGLKNKKELWRAESIVRNYRRRARELQARRDKDKEKELIEKLAKIGLVAPNATLDDVLGLTTEHLLERRLQTQVFRRGLAKSVKHARQLIVHGHVTINGRKVWWPSYIVPVEEEKKIEVNPKVVGVKEGEHGEEKK